MVLLQITKPYAYRQSQQIGNISRTTAIRILKSILSGKDNVQKIDKINDIPVNPLFDSELEQHFMEAMQLRETKLMIVVLMDYELPLCTE